MRGEDIYEDGVVIATGDGRATVAVAMSAACEECSAKIFCAAGDVTQNTVIANDRLGVREGDHVRIVVHGEDMFRAAFLLYGVPLVLLLVGLFVGMFLVDPGWMTRELWAFVLGIGLSGLYYVAVFLSGDRIRGGRMMPDIVAIHGGTA